MVKKEPAKSIFKGDDASTQGLNELINQIELEHKNQDLENSLDETQVV